MELEHGGPWRPGPHLVLSERHDYPGDVTCAQYVVADDVTGVQVYRMWFHDYTPATLAPVLAAPVLAAAGFDVLDVLDAPGPPAGSRSDPDAPWFAVLAARADR